MDLREKLNYYHGSFERDKKTEEKKYPVEKLAEELNGNLLGTSPADVIKICHCYPVDSVIYDMTFENSDYVSLPLLSRGQFKQKIRLEDMVFFDLETTGLAGGTGTYPFLLAFGFFENNNIKLIQYFLPDYGREMSAFLDLRNQFQEKSILVSYNGKSFDYPLLKNRFVLNRFEDPFSTFSHLDLLHFVRRLWKKKLDNCSLANVEKEIFRFQRLNDIEGSLIPYAYFEFLRDNNIDTMKRVIQHNIQDIISLVRLIYHIHSIENNLPEKGDVEVICRLAIENGDIIKTRSIVKKMYKNSIDLSHDLMASYSLLLKREGEWQDSIQLWENLLNSKEKILFACEELAKYYEHKERDYENAKKYTESALNYINMMEELGRIDEKVWIRQDFQHRLNRILSKQKKIKG